MTLLDVVMLALVRGVGEVLPISASGHLMFLPGLDPRDNSALAASAAADIGVIFGISLYFWRDVGSMARGLRKLIKGRPDAGSRNLIHLVIATAPALVLTLALGRLASTAAGPITAASALLVFGLFLLMADGISVRVKRLHHMSAIGAFAVGLLQTAAIIPGVSRVGITITAQRLMGYERPEAARFSLLLTIPALAASAISAMWRVNGETGLIFSTDLALAAGFGAIAALGSTAFLMAWVQDRTYMPFAVWRILLGGGLLLRALMA